MRTLREIDWVWQNDCHEPPVGIREKCARWRFRSSWDYACLELKIQYGAARKAGESLG
jgi:hypothetical protein